MAIQQISDEAFLKLSSIVNRSSADLRDAHWAYAANTMTAEHVDNAHHVRDHMISLLADFEDGPLFGALQGDCAGMLRSMRIIEQGAASLIAAVNQQDDVRAALEKAA